SQGDNSSPFLSRRSSSRQSSGRRNSDSEKRTSINSDGDYLPSASARKSPGLAGFLSGNNEKRKSVNSESDYLPSASARKSPGLGFYDKRKSLGGSDTEGEGEKGDKEKKKAWKLFSRSGGKEKDATDELSMEAQGRDKSRGRPSWFFPTGRSSPQPPDMEGSGRSRSRSRPSRHPSQSTPSLSQPQSQSQNPTSSDPYLNETSSSYPDHQNAKQLPSIPPTNASNLPTPTPTPSSTSSANITINASISAHPALGVDHQSIQQHQEGQQQHHLNAQHTLDGPSPKSSLSSISYNPNYSSLPSGPPRSSLSTVNTTATNAAVVGVATGTHRKTSSISSASSSLSRIAASGVAAAYAASGVAPEPSGDELLRGDMGLPQPGQSRASLSIQMNRKRTDAVMSKSGSFSERPGSFSTPSPANAKQMLRKPTTNTSTTPSPDVSSRFPLSLRGLPLASQLILAAEHGQMDAIRSLLDMGVSPSCRDENSTLLTPLIQAARHGHTQVVELLVERGARLEDRDPDIGGTAVFHAAINGWYETVRTLVALGADLNAPEWTGCTPVFAASFHGHIEVVDVLLEHGAAMDIPCPSGTPIHASVEGRQLGVLKMLLAKTDDIDAVDAVGRTALWIACQAGFLSAVELLLDHGAEIDKPSSEGTRPLWAAIVNDHAEIARRLVERGANIEAPLPSAALANYQSSSSGGFTPLHGAAHRNHARLAHALMERGADPEREDDTQHSPLHLAAMMGNAAVVDVILWHRPHLVNSIGTTLNRTPLFLAALWNSMEVARLLLDYGADVEAFSDPRTIRATALRAAVQGNHFSMAEMLLTRGGADPNARAADGSTCLHVAVSNGNERIVTLLIAHGVNVDAQLAVAGETPLHLATRRRRRADATGGAGGRKDDGRTSNSPPVADSLSLVRILLTAQASINLAEERAGLAPLHLAAREGDFATVALLIDHGANLEALTHSGFAPLAIAALNGRVDVVRELLEKGASPVATSFEGVSVMHAAVMGVNIGTSGSGGGGGGASTGGATPESSARILKMLLDKGAFVDPVDSRGDTPLAIASRAGNLYAVKVLVEAGANLDQLAWPKGVPPE
ncbi:hypothetical protein HDU76_002242, partial [Blyttiomyces sp. JEL0837]